MSICSSPTASSPSSASSSFVRMQCNSGGASTVTSLSHSHAQERTTDPFQSLLEAARIHLLSATGASTSPTCSSPCLSPSPSPPSNSASTSSSIPAVNAFASLEPEVNHHYHRSSPTRTCIASHSTATSIQSPPPAPTFVSAGSSSSAAINHQHQSYSQPALKLLKLPTSGSISNDSDHNQLSNRKKSNNHHHRILSHRSIHNHHQHTKISNLPPTPINTLRDCEMNSKALDMRRNKYNHHNGSNMSQLNNSAHNNNKSSNNTNNNNNGSNAMSDSQRCRSLVCDSNGIIVAEMVYRCMICFQVSDTMTDAQQHYLLCHDEDDELSSKQDEQLDACNEMDCSNGTLNKIQKSTFSKLLQPQSTIRDPINRKTIISRNHFAGSTTDSNSAEDTPIDMSPNSDSYEQYSSMVPMSEDQFEMGAASVSGASASVSAGPSANGSKSGYVNCSVCNVTRFYSCVQRRYGQFTCVTCYRYFRSFLLKPKRYSCPRLGECLLNVRTRCRACWIKACIDLFNVDPVRKQIIEANRPLRGECLPNEEEEQMLDTYDESFANELDDDDKLDTSDDNNNSLSEKAFNNLMVDLPSLLSKASGNGFGLLNCSSQLLNFGQLAADTNNNNPSLMNGSSSLANNSNGNSNQLNGSSMANGAQSSNSAHNLLLAAASKNGLTPNGNQTNGTSSPLSNNMVKAAVAAAAAVALKQPKVASSKKIWSCGKCATCVAEDCGKCIYCLDRPKFGGPFIKKQRCIKRRCLMKVKNKGNGSNDPATNDCEM